MNLDALPRWGWMRFDRPEGTSYLAVVWGAAPMAVWVMPSSNDGWRWGNPYPVGWSWYPTAEGAMRAAEIVLQQQQPDPAQSIDLSLSRGSQEPP